MAKTLLIIYFWKMDWELFKGNLFLFFKDFIYFIFRERGKEREREGEKHQLCGCPQWGPGRLPRHVPRLGIKLATPLTSQSGTQSTEPTSQG